MLCPERHPVAIYLRIQVINCEDKQYNISNCNNIRHYANSTLFQWHSFETWSWWIWKRYGKCIIKLWLLLHSCWSYLFCVLKIFKNKLKLFFFKCNRWNNTNHTPIQYIIIEDFAQITPSLRSSNIKDLVCDSSNMLTSPISSLSKLCSINLLVFSSIKTDFSILIILGLFYFMEQ